MTKKEIKFSIPYNGDLELIKWALESKKVHEVYFSGPEKFDFSDPFENMKKYSFEDLKKLIILCNEEKIKTNLLVNRSIMFFEDVDKLEKSINLLQEYGKIDYITISDPFIVHYFKKKFPNIKLQSSIYMGIDNIHKAREAIKMGITALTLDPSVNRSKSKLKEIMRLKLDYPAISIKLIGILTCYSDCFYAWNHSQLSILKQIMLKIKKEVPNKMIGEELSPFRCYYESTKKIDELRRPFIRPEDISYYEKNKLTDFIKIAYRNEETILLKKKLIAYFDKKLKGNLFSLFDSTKHEGLFCDNEKIPPNFIEKVMNCDKDCNNCNYCTELYEEVCK